MRKVVRSTYIFRKFSLENSLYCCYNTIEYDYFRNSADEVPHISEFIKVRKFFICILKVVYLVNNTMVQIPNLCSHMARIDDNNAFC